MKVEPGQKFQRTQGKTTYLIVLLSSDPEPGMCDLGKYFWRCAQFMMLSDGSLCGAQIVLYTEAELERFLPANKIYDPWLYQGIVQGE